MVQVQRLRSADYHERERELLVQQLRVDKLLRERFGSFSHLDDFADVGLRPAPPQLPRFDEDRNVLTVA